MNNKTISLKQLVLFLFVQLMNSYCISQEFVHYTQDNGLPSNKVYMVTTDNHGFIWCTTNKGIAMFNGENFKVYTTHDGLPVNDLWKIYADKKGRIWYFGRSSKLGYIENGKVFKFSTVNGSVINPTNFSITEETVGLIGSGGAYWLENEVWKFYDFQNEVYELLLTSIPSLCHLYADKKNNLCIAIASNSLTQLDTNLKVIYKKAFSGFSIEVKLTSPAMLTINNQFFYYMVADRLICFDIVKKKIKVISMNDYFSSDVLDELHIYYAGGNVVINGPAGRYILENDSLKLSIPPIHIDHIRANGYFTDSLNNTWISTPNNGLYFYPMYNKKTRFFKNENVQYLEKFNNKIYAGVENNGLFIIDDNFPQKIETIGKYFYQLESSDDSILKIVTNKEICLFDGNQIINPSFTGDYYHVLLQKHYTPFIGNYKSLYIDSGIYYLATGHFFIVYGKTKHLAYPTPGIYHIVKYRNQLLFGSTTGVKLYREYSIIPVPVNINMQVNKLIVMGDYLLVATEGNGLYSYNKKLAVVPGTESFFVNNIRKINDSIAWISTTIGAHEIILNNGIFIMGRSVLKSNGLPSNYVNDVLISNDSMFCATNNGLCIVKMNDIKFKANPNIVFTSIVANDSSFDITTPIEFFNQKNNNITLNFDISYLHEHKQLRNFYQLEPIDMNWKPLMANTLVLNGLKPGRYKIKIKSEAFNRNWDEKSIEIYIKPQWYQTTAFLVIVIICSILVILSIITFIIRNTVKKREKKHQLETKMVNLELDALRSKLNPHFIFNTFNAIQLFINNNQMDLSEKYLILLSKHIRNVFEFSHLQNITLEKEISLLKDYLEIEKIRFGDKVNINIEVDTRIDIQHTHIPSMMIQPFVENTMVHGLFHKRGIGNLILKFIFVSESIFQVQVIDDGVGFMKTSSERISSTKVIAERVALINQSDEFKVQIQRSSLDETKENKGTVITITIKHGK